MIACMQTLFKFIVPVATLALVGCQQLDGWSPYEYRFEDSAAHEVCVSVSPQDNESLRLSVNQILKEEGFVVREVRGFDSNCSRCLKFDFKVGGWSDRVVQGSLDYTRLVHGSRYDASAMEKLPEAAFGTPNDDDKVLIRALLTRIFPHPVPWRE